MSKIPPTSVIKDGNLKASIWENQGKNGAYFTTTFAKVYQDRNGDLRDTNVFNNSDLLKLSELARQAYGRTNELRQELLQSREGAQSNDTSQSVKSRAERALESLDDQNHHQSNERDHDSDQER